LRSLIDCLDVLTSSGVIVATAPAYRGPETPSGTSWPIPASSRRGPAHAGLGHASHLLRSWPASGALTITA
jgi:hypothetical protein